MFKGGPGPAVAGPTGIAQGTGEVIKSNGWLALLEFAALLSINLAIINVLPLPMLDGGRMTFVLIEILRRGKRIAPEKEAIVHLIGLALIITMAVVVTYVDIARLIGGKSIFS
jgi:regulator of sigma E protease